jgi:hypothetical protein
MLKTDVQNTCGWWLCGYLVSDGTYVGRKAVPHDDVVVTLEDAHMFAGSTFSPDEALVWVKRGELP